MKDRTIKVRPGAIICYKEYNLFKRLWYKLRKKELKYNRYLIVTGDTSLVLNDIKTDAVVYEPLRKYKANALRRLTELCSDNDGEVNFAELKTIINTVRPGTIIDTDELTYCRYYRKKSIDAYTIEHIHVVE